MYVHNEGTFNQLTLVPSGYNLFLSAHSKMLILAESLFVVGNEDCLRVEIALLIPMGAFSIDFIQSEKSVFKQALFLV